MFATPWYMLLLLLTPVAAWRLLGRRRRQAVSFSAVSSMKRLPRTMRQRFLWLPPVLTLLAIVLLIVALARPREGRERTVTDAEGIAIQMVVDRSGSMRALDFVIDGEPVNRLTAIKSVVDEFVTGGDELEGRISDLIGLIGFAGYADALTPPTLDHAFLLAQLQQTQIVTTRSEDGTAIGDAIALAVEKLNGLDERREDKVKSKIVILLTDGENTAGELEPIAAAELAETVGIKVYTIGVGTQGLAPVPIDSPFGGVVIQRRPVRIDEETLTRVAEITEGKYYRATDTESLKKIYQEIDTLEKSKVESRRYADYRELAVSWCRWGSWSIPPLLLLAFCLLLTRVVLEQSWLREWP